MSVRTVMVSNVSPSATEQHVRGYFSLHGDIENIEMLRDGMLQIAYVVFNDFEGANAALSLSDATIDGQPVIITPAPDYQSPPPPRRSGSAVRRVVRLLDGAFKKTIAFVIKHRPRVNVECQIFQRGGLDVVAKKEI